MIEMKIAFRGFDLANHLCEWMYNYKDSPDPPFFTEVSEDWPNLEQRVS